MFRVERLSAAKLGAALAMIVGAGFRLFLYWQRPSLWNDEIYVALNVITRHFSELSGRLEFEQSAPLGFLWLERLSVSFLGVSECSLRALPLLCGLASLPLSWYAARRYVSENGALLVTSVLAFSSCALFFSNAAKPYEMDLFVTLVLLFMAGGRQRSWVWALSGTLAVFVSMPAIFLLAGVWLQEAISALRKKTGGTFWTRWLLVGGSWAATFASLFWRVYAPVASDNFMKHYWAPVSFHTQANWGSIGKLILSGTLGGAFGLNVGSGLAAEGGTFPVVLFAAASALFLAGLVRAPLAVSISFGLTVLAAALGKWVFADRLMLFYLPASALAMACGMDWLLRVPRGRRFAPALVLVLAVLPAKYCVWVARHPEREELRETVHTAVSRIPAGGSVYCYNKSAPAWLFYTTDWRSPDIERVDWILNALQALDDNRRMGESLPVGFPNQGMARPWRGGWEFIGAPDGILVTTLGREAMSPKEGWADREYALVRARARAEIALVGIASGARGLPDLESKFVAQGAQSLGVWAGAGGRVVFLEIGN